MIRCASLIERFVGSMGRSVAEFSARHVTKLAHLHASAARFDTLRPSMLRSSSSRYRLYLCVVFPSFEMFTTVHETGSRSLQPNLRWRFHRIGDAFEAAGCGLP